MNENVDMPTTPWGTPALRQDDDTVRAATLRQSWIRRVWQAIWGRNRVKASDLSQYRRLAMQLHYDFPRGSASRSVVVAGAVGASAAGQASSALACCLADELRRPVLLIDACPHAPDVTISFGADGQAGLVDALTGSDVTLPGATTPTTQPFLWLLPVGQHRDDSAVATPRDIVSLLESALRHFDFVVLSGGSVLDNPLSLAFAPHVGTVLLLAVEGETRVEDLDAASNALSFSRARKVGLVLATPVRVAK